MRKNFSRWDGITRIENLFIDYLGADNSQETKETTKQFFISLVSKIIRPRAKNDFLLAVIGPQGIGKSFLMRRLNINEAEINQIAALKANIRPLVITSNNMDLLLDLKGYRRLHLLEVGRHKPAKNVFDLQKEAIDQIWAEAYHFYHLVTL